MASVLAAEAERAAPTGTLRTHEAASVLQNTCISHGRRPRSEIRSEDTPRTVSRDDLNAARVLPQEGGAPGYVRATVEVGPRYQLPSLTST